jgi:hypothetical protein
VLIHKQALQTLEGALLQRLNRSLGALHACGNLEVRQSRRKTSA